MEILTPNHELWGQFTEKLGGEDGCNFREIEGKTTWKCDGTHELATKILNEMNNSGANIDISKTLDYFIKNGGCCDCEILFNVDIEQ